MVFQAGKAEAVPFLLINGSPTPTWSMYNNMQTIMVAEVPESFCLAQNNVVLPQLLPPLPQFKCGNCHMAVAVEAAPSYSLVQP